MVYRVYYVVIIPMLLLLLTLPITTHGYPIHLESIREGYLSEPPDPIYQVEPPNTTQAIEIINRVARLVENISSIYRLGEPNTSNLTPIKEIVDCREYVIGYKYTYYYIVNKTCNGTHVEAPIEIIVTIDSIVFNATSIEKYSLFIGNEQVVDTKKAEKIIDRIFHKFGFFSSQFIDVGIESVYSVGDRIFFKIGAMINTLYYHSFINTTGFIFNKHIGLTYFKIPYFTSIKRIGYVSIGYFLEEQVLVDAIRNSDRNYSNTVYKLLKNVSRNRYSYVGFLGVHYYLFKKTRGSILEPSIIYYIHNVSNNNYLVVVTLVNKSYRIELIDKIDCLNISSIYVSKVDVGKVVNLLENKWYLLIDYRVFYILGVLIAIAIVLTIVYKLRSTGRL